MKKTLGIITLVCVVALTVLYGRHFHAWAAEQATNIAEKLSQNKAENAESDAEDAPTWWVGLSLGAVPAPVRAQLPEGLLGEADGVQVMMVVPDSPAEKAGVKPYDIILLVGTEKVATPVELTDIVRAAGSEELDFTVIRGGAPTTVKVTPEEMPEEVKQQQRIMQQGLGGFQQLAPGGIQIQIPQGAFQIQVPNGGVFGGGIKPLRDPNMPQVEIPEEVRKMMKDMLGEDPFADEEDEDADVEEDAAADESLEADGEVEETEDGELIIKKRAVKRADAQPRQGRIQFGLPPGMQGGIGGGIQVGGGVSVSKTSISQLGGKQLQVSVTRKNNDPADIRVQWGDDEYQTTDEDLDVLPEDIRARVKDMLGDDVKISVSGGANAAEAGAEAEAGEEKKELKVSKEKVIDLKK